MTPTRFTFFSGKGGVGKTSMACATAVRAADAGRATLIVTTDPASNLADVFEQPIGHRVTPISGVVNLRAMEIDPRRAAHEYRERALAPLRDLFPPEMVAVVAEQLNGPCTEEVAAFDRFVDFLDPGQAGGLQFDVVIFDTAPTGHTLRLLELPAAWSHSIEEAARGGGQTCIGPVGAITDQKAKYDRALARLRDQTQTTFAFVLQPEATSISETQRAVGELRQLGFAGFELVINGILPAGEAGHPFFAQRLAMQRGYLEQIQRELPFPARFMYLLDGELQGISRLRRAGTMLFERQGSYRLGPPAAATGLVAPDPAAVPPAPVGAAARRLLPDRGRRTIFFTGKGGVGKTVLSCVTAVWLARQGCRTLLLTTDPAAHIGQVLEVPVDHRPAPVTVVPNLWATRIDPRAAAAAYRQRVLIDARIRGRTPAVLALIAEELNSPCTEEIAAFDQFIAYAGQDGWDVVVFDTAPTGHTLRLLALPVEWSARLHGKVFASAEGAVADGVAKQRFAQVIDMMGDPRRSTFAFVMVPESTPVAETRRAAAELRTVGIEPGLVVANQVLPSAVCTTAYTRKRRQMQQVYLAEIERHFQAPLITVPLLPCEVKGLGSLVEMGNRLFGQPIEERFS